MALGVATAVACAPSESERIERVLVERAPSLDEPSRRVITRAVTAAGRAQDIDPWLLLAVIEVESTYRKNAKGRRGAIGLMQIMPETVEEVSDRLAREGDTDRDLRDPAHNIAVGAAYLAHLNARFGSWEATLTAYNYGPRRARRMGSEDLTSSYARRVLKVHGAMTDRGP